jgi:hypothetical protein
MTNITIYRAGDVVENIRPENGSVQQKQIMGSNEVRLVFKSATHLALQIGDYFKVFGEKYFIQQVPTVKKLGLNWYEYQLISRSENLELDKAQYLFLGADNTLKEAAFSLMANALDFVQLVVDNANRIGSGWMVGSVVASSQYKNLTFSKDTCLTALELIAKEYGTEYFIENKVVSLGKLENFSTKTFAQGKGSGFYDITRTYRTDEPLITRLYAFGAEKNLLPGYRDYSKRLLMTDGGYYISDNEDKYGIIENTAIFDDVFPRRESVVDWVNPAEPLQFRDSTLEFNINDQLLPGTIAKVTFNSGQLAGLTFEISSYDHGTKDIFVNVSRDSSYLDLPNDVIRPEVGDKFVLTDISMPDSYVIAAEAELLTKATEFLEKHSEPNYSYQVVFDQSFIKDNSVSLSIGDVVTVFDDDLLVNKKIRVVSTSRDIVNGYDIKVELSDTVQFGIINRLQIQIDSTNRTVNNLVRTIVVQQQPAAATPTEPAPPVHASVAFINTSYGVAYDTVNSTPINKVLKVGSPANNSLRSITINAVIYVSRSAFGAGSRWVLIGTIADDSFFPNNTVHAFSPNFIDATTFKTASGSFFSGSVAYTKAHYRITRTGEIFVWIESVAQFASLAGVEYDLFPIHVTYFRVV